MELLDPTTPLTSGILFEAYVEKKILQARRLWLLGSRRRLSYLWHRGRFGVGLMNDFFGVAGALLDKHFSTMTNFAPE